jgi:apolipoprotein N-acyltransferase
MKHHWHNLNHWLDHGIPKRDYWLCFLMGLISAAAMAPIHAFPVLLFTFPIFYRLLNKSLTTKQAAVKTWVFHFGYYTAGFYWIAWALMVDIAHDWWVLPFSLFGLPWLMAFYPAITVAIWHRMAWRGTARLLSFVVALAFAEWVRGWAFTGFPWNLWGYTWEVYLPILQSVSLFGMYGLTFFTILFAMTPTLWARIKDHVFARTLLFFTLGLFGVMFAWGMGRLHHQPKNPDNSFIVRVVQPNIAQSAESDPRTRLVEEEKLWTMSATPANAMPKLIIWPESAITLYDTWDVRRLEEHLQTILPKGSILAAGMVDTDLDEKTNTRRYYNRIAFYDTLGQRLATYDKSHLVPFGEYLPFQEYWPTKPVAFKDGEFSKGSGVTTMHLPGLPTFSPLICYEVLFPGATVLRKDRPSFLLNVTNDAWYGYTSGPFQHLGIAQTRAVEEGLPLIRAAKTGVSAVITPFGDIVASRALDTQGVLDYPLPPALKPTLFAQFGNLIFLTILVGFGALAWIFQTLQTKKFSHVN